MLKRVAVCLLVAEFATSFLTPVAWSGNATQNRWWHKWGDYADGVVTDLTGVGLAVASSARTGELSDCRQLSMDTAHLQRSPSLPGYALAWRALLMGMASTASKCTGDAEHRIRVPIGTIDTTQKELGTVLHLVKEAKLSFKGTRARHVSLPGSVTAVPITIPTPTTTSPPATTAPPATTSPPTTAAPTSPGGGAGEDTAALFVGTWLGPYLAPLGDCGPNGYTEDTFNANGTYVTTYGTSNCTTFSVEGTYQVQGSELYVDEQSTDCGECSLISFTVPFSFSNNNDTLDINGYNFVRQ
jgi:hypothetical protein